MSHLVVLCAYAASIAGCGAELDAEPAARSSTEQALGPQRFAAIAVIDLNNAPIPCAQFSAWGGATLTYVSDRNGIIAVHEPGLMGKIVSFGVTHPTDPALFPKAGEKKDIDFYAEVNLTEGTLNFVRAAAAVSSASSACTPGTEYTAILDAEGNVPASSALFAVDVKDPAGHPIPAALLISARQAYVTDNAGAAAIFDRTLMGMDVPFRVTAQGYEPRDVVLPLRQGGSMPLELTPLEHQIARRVHRLTGSGLYRDTFLLGRPTPITNPLLDADVMSQDGPMAALYRGKAFWTFGDTNHPRTTESNYRGSGGTSVLPSAGGPDPFEAIDLLHFKDGAQRDKAMADPTFVDASGQNRNLAFWPLGLTAMKNGAGQEELYSFFNAVPAGAAGGAVQVSLGKWNDTAEVFEERLTIAGPAQQVMPEIGAHAFKVKHGAEEYAYFENLTRIPATSAGFTQRSAWEAYTPLAQGSATELVRVDGRLRYAWRSGTPQITAERIDPNAAVLHVTAPPEDERLFGQLRDAANGDRILEKVPAIDWSPYRNRYTGIVTQVFGTTSALGEIWYAEADTPMGPWVYATKPAYAEQQRARRHHELPLGREHGRNRPRLRVSFYRP